MPSPSIAYFSMEIAVDRGMPTYAGGLGVLAGDLVRSAADLGLPMVAVTLLHRKGYITQHFDASGWQSDEPSDWPVEQFLEEMPQRVQVTIDSRPVTLRAWRRSVRGESGGSVPVYLLDTDLPENESSDRTLTHYLYGGDQRYRICQEAILGIGGVRMLHALGCDQIAQYHMNEGHSAFLGLELLDRAAARAGRARFNTDDVAAVRRQCVFTTHTPVAAGHDQFPVPLVSAVLGRRDLQSMPDVFCCGESLNMTWLALNLSHYVNGVAGEHAATTRESMAEFKRVNIDAITNGVHAATWTSRPFQELYDRWLPGWRRDNFSLRFAYHIPLPEIQSAHAAAKQLLMDRVTSLTGTELNPAVFTIGIARRMTGYKRNDLILTDVVVLKEIARQQGAIQIVFGGKAHPNDHRGKEMIQRIRRATRETGDAVRLIYLDNYGIELAALLTSGVDVWLNTPLPPLEASGTSGMKAALNGVPSLSVLDGWWLEGWIEGVTGWAVGEQCAAGGSALRDECDVDSLYQKLETVLLPLYYRNPDGYARVMQNCVSLNGSFFNTQRVLSQYALKAYRL